MVGQYFCSSFVAIDEATTWRINLRQARMLVKEDVGNILGDFLLGTIICDLYLGKTQASVGK